MWTNQDATPRYRLSALGADSTTVGTVRTGYNVDSITRPGRPLPLLATRPATLAWLPTDGRELPTVARTVASPIETGLNSIACFLFLHAPTEEAIIPHVKSKFVGI
jgi:hypothetical protein